MKPGPLIALLTVLTAHACTGTPEPAGPPAPTRDDVVAMSRGPCFGACPIYRVEIRGDGSVRFEGERFVEATGEHTRTVPAAEVARLFAYADSVGFFELPADITPANERACGGAWTDMPSAEVRVAWGTRDHTVRHYHGCPKAPERLTDLERRIDEVARTADWIGGSP